jgi:hypothetical protein
MKSRILLISPVIALATYRLQCSSQFHQRLGKSRHRYPKRQRISAASKLEGSGELQIEQTGKESLTISADDNLLQYLTSDVSGGRLKLSMKKRKLQPIDSGGL